MRLVHSVGMRGALGPETQLHHRRTAIEYAVAGITRQHEANAAVFEDDALFGELEANMRDWVVETILQGAYLREYHLWEKDCKEYFREMARRNRANLKLKNRKGLSFADAVEAVIAQFGVTIPTNCLTAIREANHKVNIMKHDEGLSIDHFITTSDYEAAMIAFKQFWNCLMEHEIFVAPGSLP